MQIGSQTESARRAYWTEQLEAVMAMLDRCQDYPVVDCREPPASLKDAVVGTGIRVAFSPKPFFHNQERLLFLRQGLIPAFLAAADEMNRRGWVLLVEDGYRTRRMQASLAYADQIFDKVLAKVIWERHGELPAPAFMLRRITALVATRPTIATHMSASAMDISALSLKSAREIGRGAHYLEISELTPMRSPFVSARARRNREEITALMARHGFIAYPSEFWHYSQGDVYAELLTGSGKPARYGAVDWNREQNTVAPIANPKLCLHSLEQIQQQIDKALERFRAGNAPRRHGHRNLRISSR